MVGSELTPDTFAWSLGASSLHRIFGLRVFVSELDAAVERLMGTALDGVVELYRWRNADEAEDEQIFSALEEQHRRGLQRLPSSASDWKGHARDTRESLLGNVLLSLGILSSEGLDMALKDQWASGGRETLGAVLIRMGLVTRPQLFRALEKQAELKARARRTAGPLSARLERS